MWYHGTMIKKKKTVSKSDKVDFRAKNITDGKKFYFIVLKSLIHQENLTIETFMYIVEFLNNRSKSNRTIELHRKIHNNSQRFQHPSFNIW